MTNNAAPVDAPVTGATREQGISREQVNTALVGLMDEWNDPRNINPRTQRRYKQPWSSQLWFRFMRAGLEALVPPGMVIAPAGDVLTATLRDDINWIISELELSQKAYGDVVPDYQIAVVSRLRALAAGGQS